MWRIAAVAVAVGVLVACSAGSAVTGPEGVFVSTHLPSALRAAVIRTLNVGSAESLRTVDGATVSAVYQAPDRAMISRTEPPPTDGPGGASPSLVQTYIAGRVYTRFGPTPMSVTPRPGHPLVSDHLVALNQVFLPILVLAHASTVTGTGDTYQFQTVVQSHAAGASTAVQVIETGAVHLSDGMVVGVAETTRCPHGLPRSTVSPSSAISTPPPPSSSR